MYSEYYELTEGPDNRLVKIRPTRGELAGFVNRKGQVRFFTELGAFVADHPDYVTYDPNYFPTEYPTDDLLERIASGRGSVFNLEKRIFENVASDDEWAAYDQSHGGHAEALVV